MNTSTHKTLGLERKWWILIAIGVGSIMTPLDASVANIVIPILKDYFHTSIPTLEWVITIYLLVVSGLLLTFGRLGDIRGHKSIYVWGFVLFVVGSALCGEAISVEMLIASRALQALGAAMLFANSPAILTENFPGSQRGQALGLQSAMTYLGLTIGPSLGGWLADRFSWRAVFFINLPIGLIAIALCLYFIPKDAARVRREPFDLPGALTFMTGLIAILFGLNQGNELGWVSPIILGLFLTGIILIVLFISIELRHPNPMLDLSLFRRQLFSAATIAAYLNYVCIYMIIFLMPFYLEQGRSLSAAQAGMILTAQPIIMMIVAPISGTLSDRIGSRLLSTLGMGIMAVGLLILSQIASATPLTMTILGLSIVGLGTGVFISPNTNALLGSAPANRRGIASGVMATARNSGMVMGVGLAGALFTTSLIGDNPSGLSAMFHGINLSFLTASGIALMGLLVSAARGHPEEPPPSQAFDETTHAG